MNADQVRALVAAKWPEALQSPLAVACAEFEVKDETERAIDFAKLQAIATETEAKTAAAQSAEASAARRLRADAMAHARACMDACDGWTVETLGHNIESAFGDELDADECDDIAREALGRKG